MGTQDKIEFIIPTYNNVDNLMTIIGSLKSQTDGNWTAHIIADGPSEEDKIKIKKVHDYFLGDDRINFTILPENHNDWGHTPRNYGLSCATQKWIVMTGDDNYYIPTFVGEFLTAVKNDDVVFVYCDMIHNMIGSTYQPVKSKLELGFMDIGNFMCRREYIQDLRLQTNLYEADYVFIDQYLLKSTHYGMIRKIEKVLYVHN